MQLAVMLFKVSIVALVFGLGIRATARDVLFECWQPKILMRGVFVVLFMVPLAAAAIVSILAPPRPLAIALLLLAVCPAAPLAAHSELRNPCHAQVVIGVSTTTALIAMVTVPVSLGVLNAWVIQDAAIDPVGIARLVSVLFLLPLLTGAAVRAIAPTSAEALSRSAFVVGNATLAAAVLFIFWRSGPALMLLRASSLPALLAFCVASITVAHVMAGRHEDDRTALASLCALRHPGLALLIAASNFPVEAVLPVLAQYLVMSAVVSMLYTLWRRHRAHAFALAIKGQPGRNP